MFCRGRVQIDHKESVTNSPIPVKCDFYMPLYVFLPSTSVTVLLSVCPSLILSVSRGLSVCLCLSSLSFNLSVRHSVCLALFLSVCLSVKPVLEPLCQLFYLSVKSLCQSVFQSVCRSVCLATCVTVAVGFSSSTAICCSYRFTVFY